MSSSRSSVADEVTPTRQVYRFENATLQIGDQRMGVDLAVVSRDFTAVVADLAFEVDTFNVGLAALGNTWNTFVQTGTWDVTPSGWGAERAAEKARRKLADERARDLLLTLLTPVQRRQVLTQDFEHAGVFGVIGSRGGRYLVIDDGGVYGLSGLKLTYLCHVPASGEYGLPDGDKALAQRMFIEADEERFLRTAIPQAMWGSQDDEYPVSAANKKLHILARRYTDEVLAERGSSPTLASRFKRRLTKAT